MWLRLLVCMSALVLLAWVGPPRPRPELHIPRVQGRSAATGQTAPASEERPIAVLETPTTDRPLTTKTTEDVPRSAKTTAPTKQVEQAEPAKSVVHPPNRYQALLTAVTIFALALFVGYEVINKVPTMLHTPLMSGSNAISGITIVGAIIVGGYGLMAFSSLLGFLAIVLATVNVVGGFLVTHRMLAMFKRK